MTGNVIQEFLVGLGFEVDDGSLAKFSKALAGAAVKVTALYAAINGLAAGVFKSVSGISDDFEKMGYEYRLIAPMINKALVLRQEMLKAYQAAGVNITQTIQASIKFNMSLARTQIALKAIYQSVGAKFFPLLTKQMDTFRKMLYANMPKIQAQLTRFVKLVFAAFEAVTILGNRVWSILSRVYDFFVSLDEKTSGWSTIILGVIAAWKLLNLEFLATPLGMLLAGLLAILALYDDFKTFQEGGKSLFNWGPVIPFINAIVDAVKYLIGVFRDMLDIVGNIGLAFYQLFKGDKAGALDSLRSAGQGLIDIFGKFWEILKGINGALGTVGMGAFNAVKTLFGGGEQTDNIINNIQKNPAKHPEMVQPIGSSVANGPQTNQHVSQQTSIVVHGAADANATGAAVAGQQNRVNMDMARNMKPAAQ